MFFGSYECKLDEKNRLMIPSRMRDYLSLRLYIMKGFDGAIAVYDESTFNSLTDEVDSLSFTRKKVRDYLRLQLPSVCELDMDKLGRVQIPTALVNKYKLSREVTVIGAGDHIEIWDRKAFAKYEEEIEPNFEDIAESLSKED